MGDGPIANMILLLENHGAIVGRDRLGADTLDGVSQVDAQGRPHVMIGIDKGSPARWRFDAAHELAHNLLHAKVHRESLDRPEVHRKIEEQAHHFARAFLLPLGPFGDDLFGVSLDAFRAIKPKWNASIAMMIFRAHDAGLMSEDTERKLRIGISRNKWRITEPYDETTEPEEPRVLRRSFELILNARDQTPADITGRIGLPSADVEALSGLPGGYLADFSRVTLLPSREPADTEVSDTAAQVIALSARHRSTRSIGDFISCGPACRSGLARDLAALLERQLLGGSDLRKRHGFAGPSSSRSDMEAMRGRSSESPRPTGSTASESSPALRANRC